LEGVTTLHVHVLVPFALGVVRGRRDVARRKLRRVDDLVGTCRGLLGKQRAGIGALLAGRSEVVAVPRRLRGAFATLGVRECGKHDRRNAQEHQDPACSMWHYPDEASASRHICRSSDPPRWGTRPVTRANACFPSRGAPCQSIHRKSTRERPSCVFPRPWQVPFSRVAEPVLPPEPCGSPHSTWGTRGSVWRCATSSD